MDKNVLNFNIEESTQLGMIKSIFLWLIDHIRLVFSKALKDKLVPEF